MTKAFFNKRPILIAEISANHNGDLNKAKKLISLAKENGADAVKLQTFTPSGMTLNHKGTDFKIKVGAWKDKYLWDLYLKAQTKLEWHKELFAHAKKNKIICFSAPFHEEAVDFLEKLKCPIYKIASFEITDLELIKYIALKKKPMIISTGLSSLEEIDSAYDTAYKYGNKNISLLYCVSSYPAPITDFNLNNIKIMKQRYNCTIGLSDHSTDSDVAKAAIASGAEIIEKHIKLPGDKSSLDSKFSLSTDKLREFKTEIEKVFKMLGEKSFHRTGNEKINKIFRRSIYVASEIKKGEIFNKNNIKKIRPGYGGNLINYKKLIGKKSLFDLKFGSRLSNKLIKKILN
jgi:pseudaminic acid synthase